MVPDTDDLQKSSEEFWDSLYRKASPGSGGKPGVVLERFAVGFEPGRVLDMGCARGDDAIWLARRGWTVTAVDVSSTVLRYAAEKAGSAGVGDRISFAQHDLSSTSPCGYFNLVLASYFQSPIEFGRRTVLRRAAASVAPDGHLFIIEHGSRAPWSWARPDMQYPTPEESLASLELKPCIWEQVYVGSAERLGKGPGGEEAIVTDNVILLRRL